ncbi:MAG: hypothetical protein V3V14_12015 [Saprospiraceae bacterium]
MKNRHFAVIDLGSNTFHLLIIKIEDDGKHQEVFRNRQFVGLAENGIDNIEPSTIDKAIKAIAKFKIKLDEFGINDCKVIGTAALRSAQNSSYITNKIEDALGYPIEIIDGKREAELIFKGVSLVANIKIGNHVIIDVGGGSVEFIIIKDNKFAWAESYNIGVGVLYNNFHKSDPISAKEIDTIEEHIDNTLLRFSTQLKGLNIDSMIGASGSFEVIEAMMGITSSPDKVTELAIHSYLNISNKIIQSDITERENNKNIPATRVKLIVVALILINKALKIINPNHIQISPFALKEGIILEYINDIQK